MKNGMFAILTGLLLWISIFPAMAGGCVEETGERVRFRDGAAIVFLDKMAGFVAVLAERDLYNSRGVRLSKIGAVLQQDRANLHKSGVGDRFDTFTEQRDRFYTTQERRSLLSKARYYFPCWMSPADITRLRNSILSAQVEATGLMVILFRHPNGSLAGTVSPVG